MDAIDRLILNKIQLCFPVHAHPYRVIGIEIGQSETEVWQRVERLRGKSIIRRIGGIFESRRLGYVSTLCAAKVPIHKIPILAELMKGITEITHNYLRDHHSYNMWFTIIAVSEERLNQILTQIKTALGSDEVYSLPAIKVFKIGVIFDLGEAEGVKTDNPDKSKTNEEPSSYVVTEDDRALIRILQEDIPNSWQPFSDIAVELGWDEELVIARTSNLLEHQVLRRLGAVLVHQKTGFTSNAMGVWIVPEQLVAEVGSKMGEFNEVSHCYQRTTLPDWPYNLFTMIHGQNDEECEQIMAKISEATGIDDYGMLYSHTELKKTSMKYFVEPIKIQEQIKEG